MGQPVAQHRQTSFCYFTSLASKTEYIWAASLQNQQNGMCAKRRLRTAWASAQSDQSFRCPQWESLGP